MSVVAGMLPPLILEMRSRAGEVVSDLRNVSAEVGVAEAAVGKSTTAMEAGFNRAAAAGKILGVGVLAGAAIVGVESTKMAANFQKQMTLLVSAAGESQSNLQGVSDGILQLAGSTGTTVDQLAEGMYTVEKAGQHGADGLLILKAAAEGAKAENVDLATATNALTSVMMSYHEKADQAVSVQNEMVAASGLAKTTMQNFAGSLSTVLPVASAAGVSFDQVGGAIATLTQHGTSADEATQELSNTIRNLQAPNQVAQKAMQQLGLDVNDISTKLGSRGLTGTLELISQTIASKLGPEGTVLIDTMKKSASASADLQTMLKAMPSGLSDLSQKYLAGQVSLAEYTKSVKGLGGESAAQGMQFIALAKSAQGFNDYLKTGQPAAQTYTAQLKAMLGGATGLNTALMLTGENTTYFNSAVEEIGKAGKQAGSDISTWAQTQANLATQVDQLRGKVEAAGIKIGTALIPAVSQAITIGTAWAGQLADNPTLLFTILGVLGSVVGLLITFYVAQKTAAAAMAIGRAAIVAYNVVAGLMGLITQASTAATYEQVGATYASAAAQRAYAIGAGIARVATLAQTAAITLGSEAQKGFAVVQYLARASTLEFVAGMALQKAAAIAGAVATGVMTAAQWAFNVAMDANPIGLIILAIAALIGIIILLATHWDDVTAAIGTAWGWLYDNAIKPANDLVIAGMKLVGDAATWLWQNAIQPALSAIGDAFGWLYRTFIEPQVKFIIGLFQLLGWAAGVLWHTYQPVFKQMGDIVTWLWQSVIKPNVDFIVNGAIAIGTAFVWLWENGVRPTVDWMVGGLRMVGDALVALQTLAFGVLAGIGSAFSWWWQNGVRPTADAAVGALHVVGDILVWLQGQAAAALGGIGNAFLWLWENGIRPSIDWMIGGLRMLQDAAKSVADFFGSIFSALGGLVGAGFRTSLSIVAAIINRIVDLVNPLIDSVNRVGAAVNTITGGNINFRLGSLPHVPSFDVGGTIPGAAGQPLLMVGHGGEVVLSQAMLDGRAAIPPKGQQALEKQAAATATSTAAPAAAAPAIGTVNFNTNASPGRIMSELGWLMRRNG